MEKDLVDRDIVPVAHAPDHRGDKEREDEEKNGRDNYADDAAGTSCLHYITHRS